MRGSFKLDASKWNHAVRELAGLSKKKPVVDVMKRAAGSVIRRVVGVTPPAKGKADAAAKKAGETAIAADLAKLMVPGKARALKGGSEDPEALHGRARDKRTGRVNPRSRKVRSAVSPQALNALKKKLFAQVGHLAAGFNAAAQKLGVKLPVWISRHGTRFGTISIILKATGIRITFSNRVKFVDNITELNRRLQWALNTEAKSILERQIPNAVKNVARRAGFKTS